MKDQLKKLHEAHRQGNNAFTIIEVMIVLAIAGIIMVIVFLAIPALQRNSRNTQRTSDATRVAGAIDECMANNNGRITSCNTAALISGYITLTDNQQLTSWGASSLTSFSVTTGVKCDPANQANTLAAGSNSFALRYLVEANSGASPPRCIGG